MNNYSPEVMEIHNKFSTASDKLLKKAEGILAKQVEENGEKIERLKSFGFTKTKDNTAKEDDKKQKEYQTKLIEAINFYRIKYPNYKFIPEKQAEKICKKYGLVLGGVDQYKGFVPDKNLHDIERFFEKHPEARYTYTKSSGDQTERAMIPSWAINSETSATKEEYDAYMHKESVEKLAQLGIEATKPEVKSQNAFNNKTLEEQAKKIEGKRIIEQYLAFAKQTPMINAGIDPYKPIFGDDIYRFTSIKPRQTGRISYYDMWGAANPAPKKETVTRKDAKLKICAPIADMNTQGYELKDGWKLVYDPIVSLSVTHTNGITGLVILTAWGDEASDEMVVNHNQN